MLILGILAFGMLVGGAAQLVLGTGREGVDWAKALGAGLIGSFVGGLLVSLIAGDGLQFRASGLIGSFVGALIVTAVWRWAEGRGAAKSSQPARRR